MYAKNNVKRLWIVADKVSVDKMKSRILIYDRKLSKFIGFFWNQAWARMSVSVRKFDDVIPTYKYNRRSTLYEKINKYYGLMIRCSDYQPLKLANLLHKKLKRLKHLWVIAKDRVVYSGSVKYSDIVLTGFKYYKEIKQEKPSYISDRKVVVEVLVDGVGDVFIRDNRSEIYISKKYLECLSNDYKICCGKYSISETIYECLRYDPLDPEVSLDKIKYFKWALGELFEKIRC